MLEWFNYLHSNTCPDLKVALFSIALFCPGFIKTSAEAYKYSEHQSTSDLEWPCNRLVKSEAKDMLDVIIKGGQYSILILLCRILENENLFLFLVCKLS